MKLDILNIEGNATGKSIDLPDDIFGIEPNEHVVYLAVKQFNANQRQGTHASKERSDVKGSTRKIKRQKGTGTARAGDIKNPIFRGGGRIFGPRPRNYSLKLNKKVKRLARKSALSNKANQGKIVVIEDFTFDSPKTAELH
ncbi:MAG TPA: 50S ribosomal protein L4, partial [Phaeodactylibacter sp.]|nr:50S ribosomal protein L4 [Phaeodactylibacter sp.]